MASYDQGNVLPSATGTAITAAYTANTTSAAKLAATAGQVSVYFEITTVGGSAITDVIVKFQASYDGNWADIQSTREDVPAVGIEHTINVGAAPATKYVIVSTEAARGAIGGVRVRAKANAGGSAGDIIEANMTLS